MKYLNGKFYHKRGDPISATIALKDGAGATITDLNAATEIIIHIKESLTETTPVVSKTLTGGDITINDPVVGSIKVTIGSDETDDFDCVNYYFGAQINYSSTNKIEPDLYYRVLGELIKFNKFKVTRDIVVI